MMDVKKRSKYIWLLALIISILSLEIKAQDKVQVVAKTLRHEIPYKEQVIKIVAEKANIYVEGWQKKTVALNMKSFAKHPDKNIAKREVVYHKNLIETTAKEIFIKNYFSIPKRKKEPKSNLKTTYIIRVPADCKLNIDNHFGNISIENVTGQIALRSEFGKVDVNDTYGTLKLKTTMSDVTVNQVNLVSDLESRHSNIKLNDIEGKYHINCEYGDVDAHISCEDVEVEVEGNKSNVILHPDDYNKFSYDLKNEYGKIVVPKSLKVDKLKNTKKNKHFTTQGKARKKVNIKTRFGKIDIK